MEALLATSPSWAITVVLVVLGIVFSAHGAPTVPGWFGGEANLAFLAVAVARLFADGGVLAMEILFLR